MRTKYECNNMTRLDDELKTIICKITDKKCVCTSCHNPAMGFVINPWSKDCPSYIKKEE